MTMQTTAETAVPVEQPAENPKAGGVSVFERLRSLIVLVVVIAIFSIASPVFLSAANLSNLLLQTAATGMISAGIVLILLIGEVDLSAGAVSGFAAGVMGVLSVNHGVPAIPAILIAIACGAAIGWCQGAVSVYLKAPPFIVTLAGLLLWQGALLWLLRDGGTIGLSDPFIRSLTTTFLPSWVSWTLTVAAAAVVLAVNLRLRQAQARLGAAQVPMRSVVLRCGLVLAAGLVLTQVLGMARGVPLPFVLLLLVITGLHVFLTSTRWGLYVYAVGGNEQAAARVGIPVKRVKLMAFTMCSAIAVLGGVMAASRLGAATQSAGGSDVLLLAIAGPVIAGVSLFGGRGSVWAALLGSLVIGAISNGMDLLSLDASVKLIVTGLVLMLAVSLDAFTTMRRRRTGRV